MQRIRQATLDRWPNHTTVCLNVLTWLGIPCRRRNSPLCPHSSRGRLNCLRLRFGILKIPAAYHPLVQRAFGRKIISRASIARSYAASGCFPILLSDGWYA